MSVIFYQPSKNFGLKSKSMPAEIVKVQRQPCLYYDKIETSVENVIHLNFVLFTCSVHTLDHGFPRVVVVSTLYFPVLKLNGANSSKTRYINGGWLEWLSSGDFYGFVEITVCCKCGDVLNYSSFRIVMMCRGVEQINEIIHFVTLDFLSGCQNKIVGTYCRWYITYSFLLSFCLFRNHSQKICKTERKCTSITMWFPIYIASTFLQCCTLPRHCCLIQHSILMTTSYCVVHCFFIICCTRWFFLYFKI